MKVIEATDSFKPVWDSFIASSPQSSLLQSWQWGEFNKQYGEEVYRLAVTSSELSNSQEFLQAESKILGAMLLIKRKAMNRINYYYCPHGPVLSPDSPKKTLELLLSAVEARAKKDKVAFLRIEPKMELGQYLNINPEPESIQAQYTLIIDISAEPEDILKKMKSKHRYNIRLAKRKGVTVKKADTVEEIDRFWQLMKENMAENEFQAHPKDYFATQLESLSEAGMEDLIIAKKGKKVIAANLIGYFGDTGYYLHGALDREHRNLMAPHLLQWEAILAAKEKGCTKYNFWGVAPPDAKDNHPWQGFTRFKKDFDPQAKVTSYPGTYYLPYNPMLFASFNSLRKVKKWLDF